MTSPLSGRGAGGEGWPSAGAITRLPKAEVHVHLEGCFEPPDVEQLAQEAGESPRPTDVTGMDLAQFLELLDWTCSLVRTPEQVARAAYAFAEREARSGVGYAERIDHGIRAVEDADLVAELAERQIPLDICPGSNVQLGLYPDRSSHPLDRLRRAGVPVSINTDDPALMRHSLVSEYAAAATTYSWDSTVLRDVARTSIGASFCEDRKSVV